MRISNLHLITLVATVTGALLSAEPPTERSPVETSGHVAGDARKPSPTLKKPRTAEVYLGVFTDVAPPVLAAHLPDLLKPGHGLVVAKVTQDSPAAQVGLRALDVLMSYDGKSLRDPRQLCDLVAEDESGCTIRLGFIRAGQADEISVKLAQRPIVQENLATRSASSLAYSFSGERVSASLTSSDGRWLKIAVAFSDDEGRVRRQKLEGTREQILTQLESFPVELRDQMVRWMAPSATRSRPLHQFHE